MKRAALVLGLIATAMSTVTVVAQTQSNFAGRWLAERNAAPAAGGEDDEGGGRGGRGGGGFSGVNQITTITQDASTMTVAYPQGATNVTLTFNLDVDRDEEHRPDQLSPRRRLRASRGRVAISSSPPRPRRELDTRGRYRSWTASWWFKPRRPALAGSRRLPRRPIASSQMSLTAAADVDVAGVAVRMGAATLTKEGDGRRGARRSPEAGQQPCPVRTGTTPPRPFDFIGDNHG